MGSLLPFALLVLLFFVVFPFRSLEGTDFPLSSSFFLTIRQFPHCLSFHFESAFLVRAAPPQGFSSQVFFHIAFSPFPHWSDFDCLLVFGICLLP